MITAITPIDGRYADKIEELKEYFSEYALIKYRLMVEVEYFIYLTDLAIPPLEKLSSDVHAQLRAVYLSFGTEEANQIKSIEKITNHDVKAVEYFLKERLEAMGLTKWVEFVHFGLTSQDINNTSIPLSIKDAVIKVYLPQLKDLALSLQKLAIEWKEIPMLARTHGQAASPTGLGKEIFVYFSRIKKQIEIIEQFDYFGKFGGATGNFNAHYAAYPKVDWVEKGGQFLSERLGLKRYRFTTQIEHYDGLAELLQAMNRVGNILIDLSRDIWTYISMDYFKQKTVAGEIGSSAMPHKVNPIDFENAEGNLGMSNAIAGHLANKLPISRLQRDLTDSTVLRNIGQPFAFQLIAFKAIQKGLGKLVVNPAKIADDLEANWAVVGEAIQNILRREGYPKPYEALKELTRGKQIDANAIALFINQLDINEAVKEEIRGLTPSNYTGNALYFDAVQ